MQSNSLSNIWNWNYFSPTFKIRKRGIGRTFESGRTKFSLRIVLTRSTREEKNRFACAHGSPCWSFTSQPVPPRYRNLADEFSRDVVHGSAFYKVWLPVFHSAKHVVASGPLVLIPLLRFFLRKRISFFNKHLSRRVSAVAVVGTFPRWRINRQAFLFFLFFWGERRGTRFNYKVKIDQLIFRCDIRVYMNSKRLKTLVFV